MTTSQLVVEPRALFSCLHKGNLTSPTVCVCVWVCVGGRYIYENLQNIHAFILGIRRSKQKLWMVNTQDCMVSIIATISSLLCARLICSQFYCHVKLTHHRIDSANVVQSTALDVRQVPTIRRAKIIIIRNNDVAKITITVLLECFASIKHLRTLRWLINSQH